MYVHAIHLCVLRGSGARPGRGSDAARQDAGVCVDLIDVINDRDYSLFNQFEFNILTQTQSASRLIVTCNMARRDFTGAQSASRLVLKNKRLAKKNGACVSASRTGDD